MYRSKSPGPLEDNGLLIFGYAVLSAKADKLLRFLSGQALPGSIETKNLDQGFLLVDGFGILPPRGIQAEDFYEF